jgi:phosphoribosyl 1,2-cyclic phosphodiesterase/FixJ family two-component response regulator
LSPEKKTALLIDPETADRMDLAHWLREAGWRVLEAADGETGLAWAVRHKPDLVFCDVHVPGCNGFQLCRTLRAEAAGLPNVRLILTTGSDYETHREAAAQAGADDYFVKPIVKPELIHFLTQVHREGSVTEILRAASRGRRREPAGDVKQMLAEKIPAGALTLRFWGVRGSVPTPGPSTVHYGGNTSCVEVRADGQLLVLDAGTGIRELGLSLGREFPDQPLSLSLLISHTHWDHIQGLPFFNPLYNARHRVRIFGCEGAREGLLKTLSSQMESPFFPVGWQSLPSRIEIEEVKESKFQIGAVSVETIYLNHPGVCLGYRIRGSGGSVAYLPDHEPFQRYKFHSSDSGLSASAEFLQFARRQDQKLADFVRDVDVLILDAQYDATEYQTRVGWGHGCVDDVVALALNANAKRLCLFHHDPTHDDEKISQMTQWARDFVAALGEPLEVDAAREGLEIRLGREAIEAASAAA